MTYCFCHPLHTENETVSLGQTLEAAHKLLKERYYLNPADIFNLTFEGHIWVEVP